LISPTPRRGHVQASLELIDDLDRRIGEIELWLRRPGADHRYIPLLMTGPGNGWITGFTVAAEIGDIDRLSSPTKLIRYTGLCPRVSQSSEMDRRVPLFKHRPRHLRWGLMEAAIAASSHPLFKERYQRTKRRLGRQRGAKGGPDRVRPQADRGDLVHAGPQPTSSPSLRQAPFLASLPDSRSIDMHHRSEPR
jgi:transposase